MATVQPIIESLDAATRVFADTKDLFMRRVVVPTNTANAEISFRRDALSENRLVLELSLKECGNCPAITLPRPDALATFFQSETPCVQSVGENGTETVLSNMRCQHFLVRNSPRAFAAALLALEEYLGTDDTRRMYVERAKTQKDQVERYPIGERFAPAALNEIDVTLLSDEVRRAKPWPYIYGAFGVVALALLVVVALVVYRVIKRKRESGAATRAVGDDVRIGAKSNFV